VARFRRISLAGLVLYGASTLPLSAQPWVPARGEGTVVAAYQNYYVAGHFDLQGRQNTNGATHSKVLMTEIDFGLTDTVAVTARLPYVASKYTGPPVYFVGGIPTFPGPLDDRTYHGAWQDLYLEARRMFTPRLVTVTPFVGVTLPTHDYETHGEAVPGRHRRDINLGASAGVDLGRILPYTYATGRYAWITAERSEGFPSIRSTIDAEVGHDVGWRLGLRALMSWQIRHKGPTLGELNEHDWEGHDRFIVSSSFSLGAGTSVRTTRSTEIFATWVATVSGRSGAHVGRMLAIGASYNFGAGLGSVFLSRAQHVRDRKLRNLPANPIAIPVGRAEVNSR
jgi:hypothetical protein